MATTMLYFVYTHGKQMREGNIPERGFTVILGRLGLVQCYGNLRESVTGSSELFMYMDAYLLSIDKIPLQNTGFETVDHGWFRGVGLGPAYAKDTNSLRKIVG